MTAGSSDCWIEKIEGQNYPGLFTRSPDGKVTSYVWNARTGVEKRQNGPMTVVKTYRLSPGQANMKMKRLEVWDGDQKTLDDQRQFDIAGYLIRRLENGETKYRATFDDDHRTRTVYACGDKDPQKSVVAFIDKIDSNGHVMRRDYPAGHWIEIEGPSKSSLINARLHVGGKVSDLQLSPSDLHVP
jgi:hypothetical protein